jgi:MMPL family
LADVTNGAIEDRACHPAVVTADPARLVGPDNRLLPLIAIAAGTDYAIFLIGRYQEARGAGEDRVTGPKFPDTPAWGSL